MKKLISILFLGLFWCANAYSIGSKEAAQAKLLNRFKFAIEMVIFFLISIIYWWYVFLISIVLKISIQEFMKI